MGTTAAGEAFCTFCGQCIGAMNPGFVVQPRKVRFQQSIDLVKPELACVSDRALATRY